MITVAPDFVAAELINPCRVFQVLKWRDQTVEEQILRIVNFHLFLNGGKCFSHERAVLQNDEGSIVVCICPTVEEDETQYIIDPDSGAVLSV